MKKFDPGYGLKGFSEVRSLYEAKEILNDLGVPYEVAVEQVFAPKKDWFGRIIEDKGIHIYFMDKDCTHDYGYYTPIMNTVIINKEPRPWGFYGQCRMVEV